MERICLLTFETQSSDEQLIWLQHFITEAQGTSVVVTPYSSYGTTGEGRQNEPMRMMLYITLDIFGECPAFYAFLKEKPDLNGKVMGMVVKSEGIDFTKTFMRKSIYLLNQMGVTFIGHPAVEILPEFINFETQSVAEGISREMACELQLKRLVKRLNEYRTLNKNHLKLLVLHAGQSDKSTTLMLWHRIHDALRISMRGKLEIEELHVDENGIRDCYGCPYEMCRHFAQEHSCFYGGFVVENLFPALERADIVVWVCPNYNDAISAKLMAVINRLTALYRNMPFYNKYLCAVIVSGNSGNDAVAGQLIGALCVNKGFRLWPNFSFRVLANHPNMLKSISSLDEDMERYVDDMCKNMYKNIAKS